MATLTERLVTKTQLIEQMPWLTKRMIDYWMYRDPDNFRRRCMLIVGRKTLFDVESVGLWLEEHRGAKGK